MDSKDLSTVSDHALGQTFNLSRNKSLRTLETTALSIFLADNTESEFKYLKASQFLKAVFSSISSPGPLDFVVIYHDLYSEDMPTRAHCKEERSKQEFCRRHGKLGLKMEEYHFEPQVQVFRKMHSVRDFRLVLCVDAAECTLEQSICIMEKIFKAQKAKGGFDFLLCEPLIICERRVIRTSPRDFIVGSYGRFNVPASTL